MKTSMKKMKTKAVAARQVILLSAEQLAQMKQTALEKFDAIKISFDEMFAQIEKNAYQSTEVPSGARSSCN